jgi:hypothetical protein
MRMRVGQHRMLPCVTSHTAMHTCTPVLTAGLLSILILKCTHLAARSLLSVVPSPSLSSSHASQGNRYVTPALAFTPAAAAPTGLPSTLALCATLPLASNPKLLCWLLRPMLSRIGLLRVLFGLLQLLLVPPLQLRLAVLPGFCVLLGFEGSGVTSTWLRCQLLLLPLLSWPMVIAVSSPKSVSSMWNSLAAPLQK